MVIIMRCFKTIVNKLNIKHSSMDTVKPSDYMDRFCSSLRMSKVGTKLAKHIADITSDKSKQHLWDGKSPVSIAAATIMLVSQLCQEDSGLTVNTVSSHTGLFRFSYLNLFSFHSTNHILSSFLISRCINICDKECLGYASKGAE